MRLSSQQPMNKVINYPVVIADASLLIALAKIEALALLQALFARILIPQAVAEECTKHDSYPGAKLINQAIQAEKIIVNDIEDSSRSRELLATESRLGAGEAQAILLAIEKQSLLLIDEKLGRNFARYHKVKVIGTAGVLLVAKQRELIPEVKALLEKLKQSGYRLSHSLINQVLDLAGEDN